MTTGLMAGEATIKVRAAAVGTPALTKDLVVGTEAHSQAGRAMPASPATTTAKAV